MSPFRALQGVDEGAQAIREFNDTAMEMTRIVAGMPRLIRWNLELLAFDLGQQGDIAGGLENFDSLARSAESLSQTAQELPETLRELLAEAERSGQSLGPLSQSLERTAAAVAAAGHCVGRAGRAARGAAGGSEPALAALRHPRVGADRRAGDLGRHRAAHAARFRGDALALGRTPPPLASSRRRSTASTRARARW